MPAMNTSQAGRRRADRLLAAAGSCAGSCQSQWGPWQDSAGGGNDFFLAKTSMCIYICICMTVCMHCCCFQGKALLSLPLL